MSHITANPADKRVSAQSHYEQLVLEDMDNEDTQIQHATLHMDQGQRLTPVWYQHKQVIAPTKYVKTLRVVTQGQRGEINFAKMPLHDSTIQQIETAVKSYDLKQQYYENKIKK